MLCEVASLANGSISAMISRSMALLPVPGEPEIYKQPDLLSRTCAFQNLIIVSLSWARPTRRAGTAVLLKSALASCNKLSTGLAFDSTRSKLLVALVGDVTTHQYKGESGAYKHVVEIVGKSTYQLQLLAIWQDFALVSNYLAGDS